MKSMLSAELIKDIVAYLFSKISRETDITFGTNEFAVLVNFSLGIQENELIGFFSNHKCTDSRTKIKNIINLNQLAFVIIFHYSIFHIMVIRVNYEVIVSVIP